MRTERLSVKTIKPILSSSLVVKNVVHYQGNWSAGVPERTTSIQEVTHPEQEELCTAIL